MALKNENGNYLRISRINTLINRDKTSSLIVNIKIWESEEVRNSPTEFDKPIEKGILVNHELLNYDVDNNKNIVDNIITECYLQLKQNDYNGWIDC